MSIDLFHIQLSISLLSSFFRIFPIPFHKGFFILYSSLWIILTLHLSFIWDFTWVSVPLNISSGSLWVVITRVSLFRFLLHMNAVRKVVIVNLMQWQQLFLGSFVLSLLPFKSIGHVLLSLNFLEGSSNCWDIDLRYVNRIREDFPPRTFLFMLLTYGALGWAFTIYWQSLRTFYCPWTSPWPNILFRALTPTITPQNSGFSLPSKERK